MFAINIYGSSFIPKCIVNQDMFPQEILKLTLLPIITFYRW